MSEGLSFGAYRVVRKVGQGGMGAVYLGEHTLIGRRAAIKVLHRHRSSQRESIERFFTEARATSAVEDPGIVQIYDFGVTPSGTAYLVMEYLDGEPLSARLRRLRLLAPHDAVRITRQIAGSLASAHSLGIIHRDLKPENLFMVRDPEAASGERPKILDFGIAKLGDEARGGSHRTRTGAVMGTPAYMSPEQCNDTGKIDARTDVYSLGCVLFFLLTGRPPFDVVGTGAMISAHLKDAAPRPSEVAPHLPAIVDPLIARCLAKRPDERFATMIELQQACDAVLAQLPAESATATVFDPLPQIPRADSMTTLGTSAGESTAGAGPRKLGMWIAVSAVAVAAGVVLAVMTTSSSTRDESAIVPAATPIAPAPVVEEPEGEKPKIEEPPKPEPKAKEPEPAPVIEPPPDPSPRTPTTRPPPARKVVPKKQPKPPAGNLYDDRI